MKSKLDRLAAEHGLGLTRPGADGVDVPIRDAKRSKKLLSALEITVGPRTDPLVAKQPKKAQSSEGVPKCYLPGFLRNERVLAYHSMNCDLNETGELAILKIWPG